MIHFGGDPFWLVIIKTIFVFGLLVGLTLFTIVFERKIVGRMQQRPGPNRNGPLGSFQSLADGVKLMLKEDIIPALADKPVFLLAPLISVVPAFLAFAIIPFGPTVSVASNHTPLQLVDLPVALLFALAMGSLGVYGIVLAGWSSGSTYPLLGALRSSAQMISYEVSMGLSLVAVLIFSGGLSTESIVTGQHGLWYGIQLFPSFVVYFISAVGETNRAPFDLPEAEGELVGGFHTEYSSIKFALFFLGEYINMITVSALATTIFLGGWRPPWPISFLDTGFLPIVWFLIKVLIFIFVFIWLRGTLPRLRYDQFMSFGWKVLVPFSLVWILVVSGIRTIELHSTHDSWRWYIVLFGSVVVLALVAVSFMPQKHEPLDELHDDGSDDGTFDGDGSQTTIPAQAPAGRSPFLPWMDGLPPGARTPVAGSIPGPGGPGATPVGSGAGAVRNREVSGG